MAKFDGKFLRGIIGPVILKKRGKSQQVISKPAARTVKQSAATKQASGIFGMASSLSGQIRAALNEESGIAEDGSVHSRLSSTLNQMLMRSRDPATRKFSFREDSFHGLVGFEFNDERRLADRMPGKLELRLSDGLLHVAFPDTGPPRTLKFVKNSNACNLTFSVALFRLAEGLVGRTTDRRSVKIESEKFDLNGMSFSFEVPNDCLYLFSVSMEFYKGRFPIRDPSLNIGAIYDALVVPGEYDEGRKFLWTEYELYLK